MLVVEVTIFSFALWLGAYLISRNMMDLRLVFAGVGLVAYALVLALDILARQASELNQGALLTSGQIWLLFIPALCWIILMVLLLKGDGSWYSRLRTHKNPKAIIMAVTIFFGLGLALLLIPFNFIPNFWLLLGIGIDLLILGIVIGYLDAFDEGETLSPHFFRSLIYTSLYILLFAGQVALVIVFNTGVTRPLLVLLLSIITAAILVQTFSGPVQKMFDRLALRQNPDSQKVRATLRDTADALPRRNKRLDPLAVDEEEFIRLTRRALSHMSDLPRLSASPLTNLPLISDRLQARGNQLDTLERASELRSVLTESIERLKPEMQGDFKTTDPWRYFNALYFPYVLGLKPYSRRGEIEIPDEATKKVMDWFHSQVPQRTLYNWQNTAAKMVAIDIRERSRFV